VRHVLWWVVRGISIISWRILFALFSWGEVRGLARCSFQEAIAQLSNKSLALFVWNCILNKWCFIGIYFLKIFFYVFKFFNVIIQKKLYKKIIFLIYFWVKNTLKNNHHHTFKHFRWLWIENMCGMSFTIWYIVF